MISTFSAASLKIPPKEGNFTKFILILIYTGELRDFLSKLDILNIGILKYK